MYIEDKEEFRLVWNYFADHWYDESKMNGFNGFTVLYSGPRADICFLSNLKSGSYDRLMTGEAKEFFMDNIDNPLMQELYPSFAKTRDVFDGNNPEIRKKLEGLTPETIEYIMKHTNEHKEES